MKTTHHLLRLLAALALALGLTVTAQAAEADVAAQLDKAIAHLQKHQIIDTEQAAYFKQNAIGGKGAKCDTEKVITVMTAIINKTGGKVTTPAETLDYFVEKKMVGKPDHFKKLLSDKTISGSATRSLLITLSRRVK